MPDFFQIAEFIDRFAPKGSLSNALEYAQTVVSALSVYSKGLDIAGMEEWARNG
jgi:hypothetical protein